MNPLFCSFRLSYTNIWETRVSGVWAVPGTTWFSRVFDGLRYWVWLNNTTGVYPPDLVFATARGYVNARYHSSGALRKVMLR